MTDLEHAYNYTYILRCGDGSLYTGWTNDIKNRLKMHREGKGAKYTRGRGPLTLVHLEVYDTKSEAMRRERLLEDEEWKDRLSDIELSETDLYAESASSQEDFV